MSANKQTVDRYTRAFSKSDHAGVLECLTDDIVWELPGAFQLTGKPAFDAEIENPGFIGSPEIVVTRMTEEEDVVVAEGTVRTRRRDGEVLHLRFCDVFVMRAGLIAGLTSYLVPVKP